MSRDCPADTGEEGADRTAGALSVERVGPACHLPSRVGQDDPGESGEGGRYRRDGARYQCPRLFARDVYGSGHGGHVAVSGRCNLRGTAVGGGECGGVSAFERSRESWLGRGARGGEAGE